MRAMVVTLAAAAGCMPGIEPRLERIEARLAPIEGRLDAAGAGAEEWRAQADRRDADLSDRLAKLEARFPNAPNPDVPGAEIPGHEQALPDGPWRVALGDAPKVPYLVNPKSELPEVRLWRDAERSDKLPLHKVPKGTKIAAILESKELPRTRGGTMYKVRMVTGKEGWVPHFCVEFRRE